MCPRRPKHSATWTPAIPRTFISSSRSLAGARGRSISMGRNSATSASLKRLREQLTDRAVATVERAASWAGPPRRVGGRRVPRSGPRTCAAFASSANLFERQVQDRVLRPVAIVEVPPLELKDREALGLHRVTQADRDASARATCRRDSRETSAARTRRSRRPSSRGLPVARS